MNRKKKIFSRSLILTAVLVFVLGVVPTSAAVAPNSQSATNTGLGAAEYRVGQMGDAISNVGNKAMNMAGDAFSAVSDAFQGAFDMFDDGYNPTSHVVNENGYYSQTYSNANGRNASIFVGDDNKAYTVGYPIYDSWDSVGGVEKTGYPTADAYEVGNEYYQNFTNGYVRYTDDENVSFVPSKSVNERGVERTNNSAASDARNNVKNNNGSNGSNGTSNGSNSSNGTSNGSNGNSNGRSVDSTDNITKSTDNSTHQELSGTGADASGRAGSLEQTNKVNPLMAVIGIVILAAVIVLLVSLSVAASKNNG